LGFNYYFHYFTRKGLAFNLRANLDFGVKLLKIGFGGQFLVRGTRDGNFGSI